MKMVGEGKLGNFEDNDDEFGDIERKPIKFTSLWEFGMREGS